MSKIANALLSIRGSSVQSVGKVIFEDGIPIKALFQTIETEKGIFNSPYLHFFPTEEKDEYEVTLAYQDSNGKYFYPYYTGRCTEAMSSFLVNPNCVSDVLILNIGTQYSGNSTDVSNRIDMLYGNMKL